MYQRWFGVSKAWCDIASHAEIWILKSEEKKLLCFEEKRTLNLVDPTGDETEDIFLVSKNMWEGAADRWRCLNRRKRMFPDVVAISESKNGFRLVVCHLQKEQQDWLRGLVVIWAEETKENRARQPTARSIRRIFGYIVLREKTLTVCDK